MIFTLALIIVFALACTAVLFVPIVYKKYLISAVSVMPFALAIYFFENTELYIILTIIYIIVMYILNKNSDILYYLADWKTNVPIGIACGIIVGGAFYYIVSNNHAILANNTVEYNKLLQDASIFDLLYISLIFMLIYIIGSWGILRRRPKYLNLLAMNNQYQDQGEKKDG